jgi:alkanesulfonate monooxygenase SsuD/methylene tetrahydromethanopterin reductase-like flavin-dependent oxidoreductase (luciferase family)
MRAMRFGAAIWVNRTTWPALREACLAIERAGWDSLWIDDHLLADEGDWKDPKFEGWSVLSAAAVLTERVRLGLLVGANTFRNPGLTAKLATTLDHLSNGRAVLGLGGGWFEREHQAFGLDFGAGFGDRLDRLDEAVMLIRRLLDGERVTHRGRYYAFTDAICAPRPLQPRLPILIGGSGPRKTLRTTASYADIWNSYGAPEVVAAADSILRDHCAALGRDEAPIERTVTQDGVIRDDPAEAMRVHEEIVRIHGIEGKDGADSGARYIVHAGPPTVIADAIRPYAEVGVDEVVWVFRDPFDLETIARIGEVRAALAG